EPQRHEDVEAAHDDAVDPLLDNDGQHVREVTSDAVALRSLPPCGGGTGRGVANSCPEDTRLNPPPQPSPTRGEGARRASGARCDSYRFAGIPSHAPARRKP